MGPTKSPTLTVLVVFDFRVSELFLRDSTTLLQAIPTIDHDVGRQFEKDDGVHSYCHEGGHYNLKSLEDNFYRIVKYRLNNLTIAKYFPLQCILKWLNPHLSESKHSHLLRVICFKIFFNTVLFNILIIIIFLTWINPKFRKKFKS